MVETLEERRLFERISARFPARFKDSSKDYGTEVFLRDICASGARLLTKERSFLNDSLALEIELPDGQSPVRIHGYVVWSKPHDMMWEIGMTFHKIEFLKLHRLFKYSPQEF